MPAARSRAAVRGRGRRPEHTDRPCGTSTTLSPDPTRRAHRPRRKLKALAAARDCAEAEIVRDAIDKLPDGSGSIEEQLAAAGLLVVEPIPLDSPTDTELCELEAEVEAWLDTLPAPIGLAEAIAADRHGR